MPTLIEEIVLSPQVTSELLDSIEPGIDINNAMRFMIADISRRAHNFITRFESSYFLKEENIHEFVGLEFRDSESGHLIKEIKFRFIIRDGKATVYRPDEVPLDEMYDIRTIIAESQLPEFYEDTFAQS